MTELEEKLVELEESIKRVCYHSEGDDEQRLIVAVWELGVACHLLGPQLKRHADWMSRDYMGRDFAARDAVVTPVEKAVKQTVILDASGDVAAAEAREVKPQEINLELF